MSGVRNEHEAEKAESGRLTPADRLRNAAELMGERAQAATAGEGHLGGRYDAYVLGSEGYAVMGQPREGRRSRTFVARCGMNDWDTDKANAEHLAGWSPSVALAVASSLWQAGADLWAHGLPDGCDTCGGCDECDDLLYAPHVRRALAVADAYLGTEESTDAVE